MAYDAMLMRIPELRWLGVLPSDFEKYNLPDRCLLHLTTEGDYIRWIICFCIHSWFKFWDYIFHTIPYKAKCWIFSCILDKKKVEAMLSRCYLCKGAPKWRLTLSFLNCRFSYILWETHSSLSTQLCEISITSDLILVLMQLASFWLATKLFISFHIFLKYDLFINLWLCQMCLFIPICPCRLELEIMLQKGVKFEIEALSVNSQSFLSDWYIPSKIQHGNYFWVCAWSHTDIMRL